MNNENSTKRSQTDWAKVDNLKPGEIDLSDCPEVTDEMWESGSMFLGNELTSSTPQEKLPIDKDIIEFFRSQGQDYPVRINHVLREYVEEHKA